MRSGLYNYTNAPELSASLDHDPTRVWTSAELLAIAIKHPPTFPPGKDYEYCNTNYVLLGLVAEKAEAKPLADVFKTRLFRPLGMKKHRSLPVPPIRFPNPIRMAIFTEVLPTLWWMALSRRSASSGQGRDTAAK